MMSVIIPALEFAAISIVLVIAVAFFVLYVAAKVVIFLSWAADRVSEEVRDVFREACCPRTWIDLVGSAVIVGCVGALAYGFGA